MTTIAEASPTLDGKPRIHRGFLALFVSLYALQGVVVAYLFNFNKAYMLASGLTVDKIGVVQTLALLPLALKFLVGPISDRFNLAGMGYRKPYIVLGVLAQSAGLVGLARVDPGRQLGLFAMMALLTVVGLAVYDTCCDGMVVDITPASDRARIQGWLWTSRFIAATLFTLGFGHWLEWLGGPAKADRLLLASAVLGLIPLTLAVLLSEPSRAVDAERFQWSAFKVMLRPFSIALLLYGGLYSLTGMAVESNVSLYYGHLGLGAGGDIGTLGASRNLGRAVGAVVLPLALTRFPRQLVLAFGILGLAATIAGHTIVHGGLEAGLLGFSFGAACGWNDTVFAFLAMEGADPKLAASTFALFMAVTNLSVVGDALFAKGVVAFGGFGEPFLIASGVTLLALALTVPLRESPSMTLKDPALA